MKLGVNAAVFQQISMASAFNNDTVLNHDDFVSLLDSRQTVRNHQRGTVLLQLIQGRLNSAFRFRIQRGGRFVQNQNWAIAQQRTRNGDTLTLTAGEQHPFSPIIVSRPLSILLIKSIA